MFDFWPTALRGCCILVKFQQGWRFVTNATIRNACALIICFWELTSKTCKTRLTKAELAHSGIRTFILDILTEGN
jgi:hypothetical protein